MIVSDMVRGEIRRRFDATDAPGIELLLETTPLPLLEASEMARDRDRVHLAVIKLAAGDRAEFERHLEVAKTDWRDTLVASGLGNLDWPRVLEAAGFPVPR